MTSSATLQRTPLFAAHVALGGKMVGFGGWEMPVVYSGIVDEHVAVRQRVGLFDISHMGEFLVAGPNAETGLNRLLTNDVRRLAVGQAQYTLLCNEAGGIVDDLIVYRVEPTVYLLIVNAGNIAVDFAWFREHLATPVVLDNESDQTAALALQGPAASRLLTMAAALPHFHIARLDLFGVNSRVARTGYTGEDGYEILCDAAEATRLWAELLARGAPLGIKPCGLGARDTLRLEMGYPLHGSDITAATTPLEAGLGRFVAWDKGDFIGRGLLLDQKKNGTARKLAAFQMTEKSPPPRAHYPIVVDGRRVGEITSGTASPSLGTGIGMGYVEAALAKPGTNHGVEIRGRAFAAVVKPKPLWKTST